jgi:phosphoglycerate kinase
MLPTIKKLSDLKPEELKDKTVWLRVDFNVAIVNGVVTEGYRIDRSLETINFLKNNGAKIILATHLGEGTASLEPVVEYLKTKISLDGITILPNLRSNPGEESNSDELAHEWAASADIYVNEAFAASHREHASIVGLPKLLPSYAGFNFVAEVENLSKCFTPTHPALLIVGGAKLESKQPVIDKFKPLVDKILIGGKLVYEFLNNTDEQIVMSKELVRVEDKILDIIITDEIKELVKNAKRIIWAGPMGMYDAGYAKGTLDLAEAVAQSEAESIVGGGDTIAAIPAATLSQFAFVSTGGGAMLQFLATGTLPGVEALKG